MAIQLKFKQLKETKNTIRYEEQSDAPIVGTLYVSKLGLKTSFGAFPDKLAVTVEKE
jgi:hypothetical protein